MPLASSTHRAGASLLALVLALHLGEGCVDAPSGRSYRLPDDTRVEVASSGEVEVERDGRTLLEIAGQEGIAARTYDEVIDSLFGFYDFERLDVQTTLLSEFEGSFPEAEAVILEWSDPSRSVTARMEITAGPIAESTRLHLEVSGLTGLESTAVPLRCDDESAFLGFGAQYNASNQRGESFALWVQEQGIGREPPPFFVVGDSHTSYAGMPYWVDPRGVGVVVDTSARVLVDLCESDPEVAWVEVEHGEPVDLIVLHGPTPADVVRELGDIYGRPDTIPAWAYGPWIAIQGGQQAVLDEADALLANDVPVTALWAQDWTGKRNFTEDQIGVQYRWVEDPMRYPDMAGMIESLHDLGIRYLGYANPFVQTSLDDHWPDVRDMELAIEDEVGAPYLFTTPAGEGTLPDLKNPAAASYVRGFLERMANTLDMDGWMADFGEAMPTDAVLFDGSDAYLHHNLYPEEWHSLSVEVLSAANPDGDFAVFSRSGWLGTQGSAQIMWIGDQEANWLASDGIKTVIPALLNLGLSGVPFVTHDIAGFSGGPSTKELYMRWTELGAFTTIMRTHEGLMRNDNWNWDGDTETLAHFRRFARIHEALIPELMTLAEEASQTSMPPMRHLALEYPDDPETHSIDDQFLLGSDLLVAPVLEEGATSRSVYLPEGTWFHVFTGEEFQGGQHVEVEAPIGSPPVFSRGVERMDLRAIQ